MSAVGSSYSSTASKRRNSARSRRLTWFVAPSTTPVGLVLLEELQERVEHAADLADIVLGAALATECVEFVEQVHAAGRLDRVEHQPKLRRSLAHVLGDEAVELNVEERQAELAGERCRGHRLAGAWRPNEQELPHRRETVLPDSISLALLDEHAIQAQAKRVGQGHVGQPSLRIGDGEKPCQLPTWLRQRNWLCPLHGTDRRGPSLDLVDELAQLQSELAVSAPRRLRGDLDGDRVKPRIVAICVASDERFDLVRGCHDALLLPGLGLASQAQPPIPTFCAYPRQKHPFGL